SLTLARVRGVRNEFMTTPIYCKKCETLISTKHDLAERPKPKGFNIQRDDKGVYYINCQSCNHKNIQKVSVPSHHKYSFTFIIIFYTSSIRNIPAFRTVGYIRNRRPPPIETTHKRGHNFIVTCWVWTHLNIIKVFIVTNLNI